MKCIFCNSSAFRPFNDRAQAQCIDCKSLERHRAMAEFLSTCNILNKTKTVLHFAPEPCLTKFLLEQLVHENYFTTDKGDNCNNCINFNQNDLSKKLNYPDNFFDIVIHNHVLEHVAGSYKDHIQELMRVIKPAGKMIFTLPLKRSTPQIIEGGEFLTEDERLSLFYQHDHFKIFGNNTFTELKNLNYASFEHHWLKNYNYMDQILVLNKLPID